MSKSLKIAFILIGSFFLVLISVNIYYVNLAHRLKQPVVDERYYEKGLFFQEELNKKAKAKEEGWLLDTELLKNKSLIVGENKITVRIYSEKKIPLEEAEVYLILERPATANLKQKIKLVLTQAEEEPGKGSLLTGKLNVPAKGTWELSVKALINKKAAVDWFEKITIQ